jgi:hypothetical protein
MTTISALFDTCANALATESWRRMPPSTMRTGLRDEMRYGGGADANAGGRAITISSIPSCVSTRSKLR